LLYRENNLQSSKKFIIDVREIPKFVTLILAVSLDLEILV